jgi:hypothetical protein
MPGLFDKMVCLVGENPLPVYLGIKQLATPEAEVVLVYSEATKPQAKNIEELLRQGKSGKWESRAYVYYEQGRPAPRSFLSTPGA